MVDVARLSQNELADPRVAPASSAIEPTDATEPTGATDTSDGDTSTPVSADAAFPVTIQRAFGETSIDAEPARIVSVGFTDHDVLLALDPDLIIGQYIGLEQADYDKLSQIAPTVAQPVDYPAFGAPWQVITRNIGTAVGKSTETESLVAEIEALFATARAEHPEFEGVDLAYAGVYGTDTASYYVETDGSTRMRVLQDLGFVVPDDLAALGSDTFFHDISAEQIELLDQEVVLWEPAVLELFPAVRENVLYQALEVRKDQRDIYLTDPLVAGAMAHSSVLSLPMVLDFLIPELARAVGNLQGRRRPGPPPISESTSQPRSRQARTIGR